MSKFEDVYGTPADEMNDGEFRIAVIGLLDGIIKRLDITNGKVKSIDAHRLYFKLMGIFIGGVILPILVVLMCRMFL